MDKSLVSVSGAGQPPSTCPLLESIPLELRRMIYHHVLDDSDRVVSCDWPKPSPAMRVTKSDEKNDFSRLMLTCGQVYAECKGLGRMPPPPLVSICFRYWQLPGDFYPEGMPNLRGPERWEMSLGCIPSLFATIHLGRLHVDFYDTLTLFHGFGSFVRLFDGCRDLTELSITFHARDKGEAMTMQLFNGLDGARWSWADFKCLCRIDLKLQLPEGPFNMHGQDIMGALSKLKATEKRRWLRINRKSLGNGRVDDGDVSDDDVDLSDSDDDSSDDGYGSDDLRPDEVVVPRRGAAWKYGAWINRD